MKFFTLALSMAILMAACQAPLVAVRHYTFESKFIVDGKRYDFKTDYTCHLEDSSWVSDRGKSWHIRDGESAVRIVGKLENGSQFEVLPYLGSPYRNPTHWLLGFCSEKTETVDASLFIESGDTQAESFDRTRTTSATHKIQLVESKISLIGSGLGAYIEDKNLPKEVVPAKRYYLIRAIVYEKSAWDNPQYALDSIKNKKILWLEKGKTYPFSSSLFGKTVGVVRGQQPYLPANGFIDSSSKLFFVPDGSSWVASTPTQEAIHWQIGAKPSDLSEQNELTTSQEFRRWIVYEGTRIELPLYLKNYNRMFYEPEYDRIIEFRVEYVDLW